MTERRCANTECRKVLARRKGEERRVFLRRTTCGQVCAKQVVWAKRREAAPPCPVCNSARKKSTAGYFYSTCATPECVNELRRRNFEASLGWPMVTGEIDFQGGFGAHNLNIKRDVRKIIPPDKPCTLAGVTGSILVRGTE